MDFRYVTADERVALYNEVWAEPVTIVAKWYNISDNGLRKHCIRLGIPLPPRGYWVRIKTDQKVPKTALPKVIGEVKKHVRNYVIKYRTDFEQLSDDELLCDEDLSLLREETKIFIRETCSQIQVKGQLRNPHHLITEHKEEVINMRKRDKELKQVNSASDYYSSSNSKYRVNKAILPIHISELNINRVYRILNTIMYTLEELEGYTQVAQQSSEDTGHFCIMRASFQFELKEEVRKKRASKDSNDAKTCLTLTLSPRSWFTSNINSRMEYKDNDNEQLENQLGRIIYDMFVVANKLMAADEQKGRDEKRKWEERERQRILEKMRKGELEEVKLLEQAVSDWDKAQKIRSFADCMELKIFEISDEEKKEKLIKWVEWARNKADWLDPLSNKEDDLLGKSQYIFDLIKDMDL